jgi:hypothetical protein
MIERKHLVSAEVDRLIDATKGGRNAAHDHFFFVGLGRFFSQQSARLEKLWR